MSDSLRNTLYFLAIAVLLLGTGYIYSWNSAIFILNFGLISAIMALGVNLQWGFAGLFNVGIMGFTALGGLAAFLVIFALAVSTLSSSSSGARASIPCLHSSIWWACRRLLRSRRSTRRRRRRTARPWRRRGSRPSTATCTSSSR